MIRNILAVLVGLSLGMVVNSLVIRLNGSVLFPMPEGMDMQDLDQMNAYFATLPALGFLVAMAAHLGQSFVGGWVAARLSVSSPMLLAMTVGVASLAGGMVMMTMIDGPAWMLIELPLYLVVAWFAGHMEVRRRGLPLTSLGEGLARRGRSLAGRVASLMDSPADGEGPG